MKKYLLIVIICIAACIQSAAQETSGGLQGQVLDTAGKAIHGASVTATHIPSGTRYRVVTLNNGRFIFTGMRIGGPYQIEITYTGLKTESRTIPAIALGEPLVLDVQMEPQAA